MKKILVHFHLFYHSQVNYFIKKLKNITDCDWDLYVTTCEDNQKTFDKIIKLKPDAHIIKVLNIGYDIYPFIKVIKDIDLKKYDYVLKIHTKAPRKILGISNYDWRNDLIEALLGNKRRFKDCLNLLEDKTIGMIGAANWIYEKPGVDNEKLTSSVCKLLNIEYKKCPFIAGTCFITRIENLLGLVNINFTDEDFKREMYKTGDACTLAHSIEYAFGMINYHNGYSLYGVGRTKKRNLYRRYTNFIRLSKIIFRIY